jgi:hypothetical protein
MKNHQVVYTSFVAKIIIIGVASMLSTPTVAAPVDLSFWSANGPGNWTLQPGNNAVSQSLNRAPSVFHNGKNSQGLQLSGEITVQTTGDDDYIGFVLGYNEGDTNNSASDYLLIDWKQSDQGGFFGGTALSGLAVSRVTDVLGESSGAWLHDSSDGVQELQRGTNLGSTGWLDNTTYEFDIVFGSSLVEVFVNDVKELSIEGSFNDGSFGFYNYSQSNVLYSAIDETITPPVPVPAAVWLFGSGLIGLVGIRRKSSKAA